MHKLTLLLFSFLFSCVVYAQFIPFAFWGQHNSCPEIGDVCDDGTIYAGVFDGGKYYITPGNCNNSSTPTCPGGTDTLQKAWRGSSGSDTDVPGVENVAEIEVASSSSYRGHVNTPVIVAHASVSSDSAADYCNEMVFAGHSDWYLPAKSEMTYIFCKTSGIPAYDTSYPHEAPNCTSMGGKTSELIDFKTTSGSFYLSSSEQSNSRIYRHGFYDGENDSGFKSQDNYVRCVRRK